MTDQATSGHLSIGEVLSLVQADFPDVSISKIRFLESQGLIAPERTASGYRKFYDADIDRLRWILRQQRDHFLPLKVIKKMLDQGVETAGDGDQPSLFGDSDDAPAADADRAPSERGEPGDPAGGEASDGDQPAGSPSPPSERSAAHPAVKSAPKRQRSASRGPRTSDAGDPAASVGAAGSVDAETDAGAPAELSVRQGHATPADVVAALQEGPGGRGGRGDEPSSVRRRSVATAAVTSTERLTRDELLEAARIDDAQLSALEEYGLVIAVTIGNSPTYDAESLEVARLAVRYAALGVEARHLRMYKVAAEREAGFVEQLVVPLLKQRNPQARGRAVEQADELAAMGSDLHAALLRQRLGPVIGP